MTTRAQKLRANSTPAERRMWRILYTFRTAGVHFRKQVALGPYVVDIACHDPALVIEVDGWTHSADHEVRRDAKRDEYLRSRGYHLLRVSNLDVMHNPEGVFQAVTSALAATRRRGSTPSPTLPARGRVPSEQADEPARYRKWVKSPASPRIAPLLARRQGEAMDQLSADEKRSEP